MENYVSEQLLVFCQSVLLGLCAGVVYDLLRALRLRLPRLTAALDVAYCLAAATALFLFTLRRAEGQLRLYVLLGLLGGAAVFFCAFSAALRPVWAFWAETLAVFWHLLTVPLVRWGKFSKKLALRGKKLFYFGKKCYTIRKTGRMRFFTKEDRTMAEKTGKTSSRRTRASVLTKILILALLVGLGFQLYRQQSQVRDAQGELDALKAQVETQQQENDALSQDIAEGPTQEKMEEIAREQLGMVSPGERVFYDVSN